MKELEAAAKYPTKVDLSDVNGIAEIHEKGGKAMDIIHLEFEQRDRSDDDINKKQR